MNAERKLVPAPRLDDRTFDELRKEALARVARFLPDWTDNNPSDPGTTLIELFAWFTEVMLYRFNQVPELNRRTFLDLLGFRLRPPRASEVRLVFQPVRNATRAAVVPLGTPVAGEALDGSGQVFFETQEDLQLVPHPRVTLRVFDGQRFQDHTLDDDDPAADYAPFGDAAGRGTALYLGFAPPKKGDPVFPEVIRLHVTASTRRRDPPGSRPDVTLAWEYAALPPGAPTGPDALPEWLPLRCLRDDTRALTRDGEVLLAGPPALGDGAIRPVRFAEYDDGDAALLLWIRCRLADGAYPVSARPRLARVQHNAVTARQWVTVRGEHAGISAGRPSQTFALVNHPILAGSLELVTLEDDGEHAWTQVADLRGCGADERGYTLDEASGTLSFGDGRHGAPPPDRTRIVARRYRFGGGARGNVASGSVTRLLRTLEGVAKVTNPEPAAGGCDAESVDELVARAPTEIRRRSRAVTADDFAEIVHEEVGGVGLVRALPLVHPGLPGREVPGSVTLVVVPSWDFRLARRFPAARDGLCGTVRHTLDAHRLVGTELHVVPARETLVRVRGHVLHDARVPAESVRADLLLAIRMQLVPRVDSRPSSDSAAWEPGALLRPELLLAHMLRVEGVVTVRDFVFEVSGRDLPRDEVLHLAPDELAWEDGTHRFTFEPIVDARSAP